jgi:hypothetical protein
MVESEGPQLTPQHGEYRIACWISDYINARVQKRAHARTEVCSTQCFYTATMIPQCATMLGYTYIVSLVDYVANYRGRLGVRNPWLYDNVVPTHFHPC